MKKILMGLLVCTLGMFVTATMLQAEEAAAPAAAAKDVTIKGKVNVVKDEAGAVKGVYVNPKFGHGYKINLEGEGQKLVEMKDKLVEVTGEDINKLFTVKSVKPCEEEAVPEKKAE